MIRTPLCDLLGVDHPVIQGALGPWSSVELAAAVSNAGALGTLATTFLGPDRLTDDVARLRRLTDAPFAVNLTMRPFDESVFDAALEARPHAVSLALGARKDLVERAHAAGILFVQQVHSTEQAREAVAFGADVVVAQGGEAGGFGGGPSTMNLAPAIVDAISPTPVVVAGGVVDGRGLAAALALGATGVQLGTRFLVAAEANVPDGFRDALLAAGLDATVRAELPADALPDDGAAGYGTRPRILRTPALADWQERLASGKATPDEFLEAIGTEARAGRAHEILPFSGESAGRVDEVVPAAEVVRRLVEEAAATLRRQGELVASGDNPRSLR